MLSRSVVAVVDLTFTLAMMKALECAYVFSCGLTQFAGVSALGIWVKPANVGFVSFGQKYAAASLSACLTSSKWAVITSARTLSL